MKRKSKKMWERENPRKKPKKLSPAQKKKAKLPGALDQSPAPPPSA